MLDAPSAGAGIIQGGNQSVSVDEVLRSAPPMYLLGAVLSTSAGSGPSGFSTGCVISNRTARTKRPPRQGGLPVVSQWKLSRRVACGVLRIADRVVGGALRLIHLALGLHLLVTRHLAAISFGQGLALVGDPHQQCLRVPRSSSARLVFLLLSPKIRREPLNQVFIPTVPAVPLDPNSALERALQRVGVGLQVRMLMNTALGRPEPSTQAG